MRLRLLRKTTELWNGSTIEILVEDRYIDSGEILIHYSDDMESATVSLILDNLIEFRDNLDLVIEILKKVKK